MTRPMTAEWNCETETETIREMTEEEYAALIESGWTETAPEETPTE